MWFIGAVSPCILVMLALCAACGKVSIQPSMSVGVPMPMTWLQHSAAVCWHSITMHPCHACTMRGMRLGCCQACLPHQPPQHEHGSEAVYNICNDSCHATRTPSARVTVSAASRMSHHSVCTCAGCTDVLGVLLSGVCSCKVLCGLWMCDICLKLQVCCCVRRVKPSQTCMC